MKWLVTILFIGCNIPRYTINTKPVEYVKYKKWCGEVITCTDGKPVNILYFPDSCEEIKDTTLPITFESQQKDSVETVTIISDTHNGICCWIDSTKCIMHWSYKRKEWCLLTDSLYEAYYHKSYKFDIKNN